MKLQSAILHFLERERERHLLWLPVPLGAGILAYFAQVTEPPVWVATTALILASALLAGMWRRGAVGRALGLVLLCAALGFAAAQWQTWRVAAAPLARPTPVLPVTGRVAEIEVTEEGSKLLLEQVRIEGRTLEETPSRVRVTLKFYDPSLVTGEWVRLRAGLFPPSRPAMPGSFDFARYFYFRQIGAVGFGLAPIERVDTGDGPALRHWIAERRHRLTEAIRSAMPAPYGAVAAALITGETSAIPPELNQSMRASGLYHLLAVSGMNLAIVAGMLFFSVRLLLAAIPPFSLRWNAKKWAAACAMIGSFIYLIVAGNPVSAQRAFLMVTLLLGAVLLEREVTPMRSLAFAALAILLYDPASLLGAGFQLSFVATMALVALYESGRGALTSPRWHWRIAAYLAAASATAFVAWMATTPLVIYHFNQLSTYSLLANILVEPLIAFWIMPGVVLAVLLMPLGIAGPVFYLAGQGIRAMVWVADYTAGLPHAAIALPPLSEGGVLLATFGGLWLCLWQTRLRWAGAAMMLAGCATLAWFEPPDVLISENGKHIAARIENGQMVLLRGRTNNFTVRQWQQRLGMTEIISLKNAPVSEWLKCDKEGCWYRKPGKSVLIAYRRSLAAEECAQAQWLVLLEGDAESTGCDVLGAQAIDLPALAAHGTHALWITGEGVRLRRVSDGRGLRPWSAGSQEGGEE